MGRGDGSSPASPRWAITLCTHAHGRFMLLCYTPQGMCYVTPCTLAYTGSTHGRVHMRHTRAGTLTHTKWTHTRMHVRTQLNTFTHAHTQSHTFSGVYLGPLHPPRSHHTGIQRLPDHAIIMSSCCPCVCPTPHPLLSWPVGHGACILQPHDRVVLTCAHFRFMAAEVPRQPEEEPAHRPHHHAVEREVRRRTITHVLLLLKLLASLSGACMHVQSLSCSEPACGHMSGSLTHMTTWSAALAHFSCICCVLPLMLLTVLPFSQTAAASCSALTEARIPPGPRLLILHHLDSYRNPASVLKPALPLPPLPPAPAPIAAAAGSTRH